MSWKHDNAWAQARAVDRSRPSPLPLPRLNPYRRWFGRWRTVPLLLGWSTDVDENHCFKSEPRRQVSIYPHLSQHRCGVLAFDSLGHWRLLESLGPTRTVMEAATEQQGAGWNDRRGFAWSGKERGGQGQRCLLWMQIMGWYSLLSMDKTQIFDWILPWPTEHCMVDIVQWEYLPFVASDETKRNREDVVCVSGLWM